MKAEPTKTEMDILQVIWEFGPSTVRFVNDQLKEKRQVNYTSTLKKMQVMTEKQLLKRDESQMKHIYHAVEKEGKTKSSALHKFVNNVYKGSASRLVMQLLKEVPSTKQELQEIRDMIDKLDKP
jgi:BlaI family transcriptional regulator, penicillinase repressor